MVQRRSMLTGAYSAALGAGNVGGKKVARKNGEGVNLSLKGMPGWHVQRRGLGGRRTGGRFERLYGGGKNHLKKIEK